MHFIDLPLYIIHPDAEDDGDLLLTWSEFLGSVEYLEYWNEELLVILQSIVDQYPDTTRIYIDCYYLTGHLDTENNGKIYFEYEVD